MFKLRALGIRLLADGKIDKQEVEQLQKLLQEYGPMTPAIAEFLIDLHKRVERVTPVFEKFFYQTMKKYFLEDGKIDRDEAAWLREMIWADGKVDDREKKLLRELRGEAQETCQEFEELCAECAC